MDDLFFARPLEACQVLDVLRLAGDQNACWQHVGGCFACLRNMGRMYLAMRASVEQNDPLADRVPDLNRGMN